MKKKIFYLTFMLLCLFTFKSNVFAVSDYNLCHDNDWLQDYYYFDYKGGRNIPYYYGYGINCSTPVVEMRIPYSLVVSSGDSNVDVKSISVSVTMSNNIRYYGEAKNGYFSFYIPGQADLHIKWLSIFITLWSESYTYQFAIFPKYQTYNVYNFDDILNALNKIVASSNAGLTDAINNQTNQQHQDSQATQEKIDETKESIDKVNDSLTSSEVNTDSAGGFFNNFSDTDHGGIRGVINAPLKFLKHMTDTCKPIEFEIYDTKITLPCGDTLFWNKEEVQEFRATWNCIFGGAILYNLVLKLFKVIEGLKNPDDSRIEVMKL